MLLERPAVIDRAQALRYLGASGWQPDAATEQLFQKAEKELLQTATPRGAYRIFPREILDGQEIGRDLERHLAGCSQILLLAVTLGTETDALLHRLEVTDIALAAVADSMASVLLEQVCDALEAELRREQETAGWYLTGRYAPGYGDCPLELNTMLCRAVDTVRGCGMAVTPQHLLSPRKSTTAFLGMARRPVKGARAGCATCHLRETCAYRKRGMTCET